MCPQSSGLVKSDPMNTTKGRVPHNYSSFDESLSYKKYMLLRYADYSPSFEMEGVPEDDVRLNTKDMIDSLSLNSPFKGTIRKIKESFKVPNMAMLPFNWDQIYTQPSVGGDVPQDANTVFLNFPANFADFWFAMFGEVVSNLPTASSTESDLNKWFNALMRTLVVGEYVYSKGSLLNKCGYKASAQFQHISTSLTKGTYDFFFDTVISAVFSKVRYFRLSDTVLGVTKYYRGLQPVNYYGIPNERYFGSFRSALDALRENPMLTFSFDQSGTPSSVDLTALVTAVNAMVTNGILDSNQIVLLIPNVVPTPTPGESELTELNPNTLNYQRLLAYQLIYFHFYTNSSLDPVYSAELYRQYVHAISVIAGSSAADAAFSINGSNRRYDFLSGRVISRCSILDGSGTPYVFTYANLSYETYNSPLYRLCVLASIFATRHSLRYGDYFVGSRPRPLAPINTNVPVVGGNVSVVDITQKQWSQKFGNAVMRARQKVENYTEMLFGKKPDIDYHNPLFLSRETDVVYGDEVQNTGAAQLGSGTQQANSRTANLRGGLGQFTFSFHNDDQHPCVYMQIISFDIKRAYTRSVDRQFLHIDRYDMFNPNFQYIGDQPIYGIELGYPESPAVLNPNMPDVFGYHSRDMEYKQRFDVVCDGFEDNLPGWILTDVDRDQNHFGVLDADFIRNENTELDRFYLSLTGYSLGTYFHFICITQNNVYAKRAMAVDPQILG